MNTPINNIITEPLSAETVEAIEMQAELETIRKPKEAIAREMFNIQAVDLIFKFKSYVEMVLSPDWKQASEELYAMVGREAGDCIRSDFFVDHAQLMTSFTSKWTSERTF